MHQKEAPIIWPAQALTAAARKAYLTCCSDSDQSNKALEAIKQGCMRCLPQAIQASILLQCPNRLYPQKDEKMFVQKMKWVDHWQRRRPH